MKGGIFTSYMSVLVNGSTTQDFKVSRSLRQGDPLSPLLFLIVVEWLALLVSRATRLGILSGFKLNDEVSYNLLMISFLRVMVRGQIYGGENLS